MKSEVLTQLALNTNLIPDEMRAEIKVGKEAPIRDIVMGLLTHSLDCWAMTENDSIATWTEKRLARQMLVIAFMLALGQE